jgi:hypothetical protein
MAERTPAPAPEVVPEEKPVLAHSLVTEQKPVRAHSFVSDEKPVPAPTDARMRIVCKQTQNSMGYVHILYVAADDPLSTCKFVTVRNPRSDVAMTVCADRDPQLKPGSIGMNRAQRECVHAELGEVLHVEAYSGPKPKPVPQATFSVGALMPDAGVWHHAEYMKHLRATLALDVHHCVPVTASKHPLLFVSAAGEHKPVFVARLLGVLGTTVWIGRDTALDVTSAHHKTVVVRESPEHVIWLPKKSRVALFYDIQGESKIVVDRSQGHLRLVFPEYVQLSAHLRQGRDVVVMATAPHSNNIVKAGHVEGFFGPGTLTSVQREEGVIRLRVHLNMAVREPLEMVLPGSSHLLVFQGSPAIAMTPLLAKEWILACDPSPRFGRTVAEATGMVLDCANIVAEYVPFHPDVSLGVALEAAQREALLAPATSALQQAWVMPGRNLDPGNRVTMWLRRNEWLRHIALFGAPLEGLFTARVKVKSEEARACSAFRRYLLSRALPNSSFVSVEAARSAFEAELRALRKSDARRRSSAAKSDT